MKQISIVNPIAGWGKATTYDKIEGICHVSSGVGDIEEYTYRACLANPAVHVVVYGGDGSVNEAVNGVMRAKAGKSALISIVPTGTGNDFVRSFKGKNGIFETDLIRYDGRYAVNALNIGFDSDVVARVAGYKKLPAVFSNFSYSLGVAGTLIRPMGEYLEISLVKEDNEKISFDGSFLLCVVSNASYYGGGFMPAPLALTDDSLLDVMVVSKISRLRFISLVGEYKKGLHIDSNIGDVAFKFSKFIKYFRCKEINISGFRRFCIDGELREKRSTSVTVTPRAVRFKF